MTYSNAVKEGVRLIHGNWRLIIAQLVMSVAGCMGFFLIVGLPLLAAFLMLGIDIAELGELSGLLEAIKEPSELIGRYSGIIVLLLVCLAFYMTFAFAVWIFVLGATAGTIRNSIRGTSSGFRLNDFFAEGKRLFLPLAGYMMITGIIFIGAAFVLGMLGGGAAAVSSTLGIKSTVAGLVFKVLLTLTLMLVGFVLIVMFIALSAQGTLAVVFDGTGPLRSLKRAYSYLRGNPDALGFYGVIITGYVIMYFLLVLPGYPMRLIPIIGVLLSLPYQIFSYVFQSYICLVALASLSVYYYSFISAGSTPASDTSAEEAPPQAPPQEGPEPPPQA